MTSWLLVIGLTFGALAGGACSGTADALVRDLADDAVPARVVSLDEVAPFFIPGETVTWEVTFRGIEGGRARLAVGAPALVDGRTVLAVRADAESSGLIAVVKTVRDDMSVWLDAETALPIEARGESNISGKESAIVTVFDHAVHVARLVVTRDGKARPTQRRLPDAEVYDPLGVILLLRGWDAPANARTTIVSLGGRTLWRTELVVAGRGELKTPIGKRPAVRLDGTSVRLAPDGVTVDTRRPARRFSVWISDDRDRVPLRIRAYTELGDVDATVTSWAAPAH